MAKGLFRPGSREDNLWLDYSMAAVPSSAEDWQKTTFVDKTHWGFYCWPKNLRVYAPQEQQPPLKRAVEDMTEVEGMSVIH